MSTMDKTASTFDALGSVGSCFLPFTLKFYCSLTLVNHQKLPKSTLQHGPPRTYAVAPTKPNLAQSCLQHSTSSASHWGRLRHPPPTRRGIPGTVASSSSTYWADCNYPSPAEQRPYSARIFQADPENLVTLHLGMLATLREY